MFSKAQYVYTVYKEQSFTKASEKLNISQPYLSAAIKRIEQQIGAPLFERSLETIKYIHKKTNGILPIIGVGGIMTPEQAQQMLDAGASLIQIYSGFIYNGPALVKNILKHIKANSK